MIRTPAGFGGEIRIKRYADYYQAGFGVTALSESTPFTPAVLFAAGEQGVWYDPSDFSTMFQDVAGTTPVTATGQSVLLIRDKSGRGNNATQAVGTSAPTLGQDANGKYYLLFDGSDDSLATGSIDFSGTDKMTVFAGIRKVTDAAGGTVVELSASADSNSGTFFIRAPQIISGNNYIFRSRGTITANAITPGNYTPPITNVLTGIGNISGDVSSLRVNGVEAAATLTDQGTGNYGNYPLYFGRRGGANLPFSGFLYSMIVRGAASSVSQIDNTETWVNGKTGAY